MFTIHTNETAPEAARPLLDAAQAKFGFVPNLLNALAESPAALQAYLDVSTAFGKSSLTPAEQQVVLLTTSFENRCHYCMAAHSTIADMAKVPEAVVEALRSGDTLPDSRLEALRRFTLAVVQERGWVSSETVDAFLAAGYTKANVLDVITGVTQKTLSNYANHLIETPVDPAFQPRAWEAPAPAGSV